MDKLKQTLRIVLEEVKAEISTFSDSPEAKTLYKSDPFVLRVVSPLAEGSDRIIAAEAIRLEYQLVCPMPFVQAEFEKDFLVENDAREPKSLERFHDLLECARKGAGLTTFELDGERLQASKAYGLAGRIVLNQSDLLIAIWDGGRPAGAGGTVETLREAVRLHVPVLWIDAQEPHAWQLLENPADLDCLDIDGRCVPRGTHPADPAEARKRIAEVLRPVVRREIALPTLQPDSRRVPIAQSDVPRYFRERKPWINLGFAWKLFRDIVGSGKLRFPKIRVSHFELQIAADWPIRDDHQSRSDSRTGAVASVAGAQSPLDLEDWINRRLRPHYAWSDRRADLYADAYRSAYVWTYLLSATAVLVALLPMVADLKAPAKTICVALEFAILCAILVLFGLGRARHWHERWMEYRLLAELIRQLRILIPLGGGRPYPRSPAHLRVYGDLTHTWMFWHMAAIARATGIPPATVTPGYVLDCLAYVGKVVGGPNEGQLKFHRSTEMLSEHIAHRLHRASTILFGLTLACIGVHLLTELADPASFAEHLHVDIPERCRDALDRGLVLISAFFPALAAALAGISNQGEFSRVAKRSAAMADSFEKFSEQIKALLHTEVPSGPKLSQVVPLAGRIAQVMVDEVADWRVVFTDRPPTAA